MIGKKIVDTNGKEYTIVKQFYISTYNSVYGLECGAVAKFVNDTDRDDFIKKVHSRMSGDFNKAAGVVVPIAVLEAPYTGYILPKLSNSIVLEDRLRYDGEIEFNDWFNKKTGGILERIHVGISLARCLRTFHERGYVLSNLSPENILIQPFTNEVVLFCIEDLIKPNEFDGSDIRYAKYVAPELREHFRMPSSLSDVYSYAVILFELLRRGHPFVGEQSLDDKDKAYRGKYPYIDDPNDESNRQDGLEFTQHLITDPLRGLFERTFCEGLLNAYERPTLSEYIEVLEASLDIIRHCGNLECQSGFFVADKHKNRCIWCQEEDDITFLEFYETVSVSDYKIVDSKNLSGIKDFVHENKVVNTMVLNNDIVFLKNKHFDPMITNNRNKEVLKIEKLDEINYAISKRSNSIPLYMHEPKLGLVKMEEKTEYVFKKGVTAILYPTNYNVSENMALDMSILNEFYNVNDNENGLQLRSYVKIL